TGSRSRTSKQRREKFGHTSQSGEITKAIHRPKVPVPGDGVAHRRGHLLRLRRDSGSLLDRVTVPEWPARTARRLWPLLLHRGSSSIDQSVGSMESAQIR